MHSKLANPMRYPTKGHIKFITTVALTIFLYMLTAEAAQNESEEPAAELPEHRARPLPADAFKPSEEISEDFPVPMPVDI